MSAVRQISNPAEDYNKKFAEYASQLIRNHIHPTQQQTIDSMVHAILMGRLTIECPVGIPLNNADGFFLKAANHCRSHFPAGSLQKHINKNNYILDTALTTHIREPFNVEFACYGADSFASLDNQTIRGYVLPLVIAMQAYCYRQGISYMQWRAQMSQSTSSVAHPVPQASTASLPLIKSVTGQPTLDHSTTSLPEEKQPSSTAAVLKRAASERALLPSSRPAVSMSQSLSQCLTVEEKFGQEVTELLQKQSICLSDVNGFKEFIVKVRKSSNQYSKNLLQDVVKELWRKQQVITQENWLEKCIQIFEPKEGGGALFKKYIDPLLPLQSAEDIYIKLTQQYFPYLIVESAKSNLLSSQRALPPHHPPSPSAIRSVINSTYFSPLPGSATPQAPTRARIPQVQRTTSGPSCSKLQPGT